MDCCVRLLAIKQTNKQTNRQTDRLTDRLTVQLTTWRRVLLEKLSHTSSQEILHLLWNLKFQYHVHKSLPLVQILSQMHPVHTFPYYFTKIHSNINLPSLPSSHKWSLPFRFSNQSTVYISHLSCNLHVMSI